MSLKFDLSLWTSLDADDRSAEAQCGEHRLAYESLRRLDLLDRAWVRALNALADADPALASTFLSNSAPYRNATAEIVRELRQTRRRTQPAIDARNQAIRERVAARNREKEA